MNISWFQLLRVAPKLKDALVPVGSKNWTTSNTIWYNVIATGILALAALGIKLGVSDEDIQAWSGLLVLVIPPLGKLIDGLVNVWLRLRTNTAIAGTKAAEAVKTCDQPDSGGVPGQSE
jgi:hypothetical protein